MSAGPSATLAWLPLLDNAAKLAQPSAQAQLLARFGMSQEQKVAAEAGTVYRYLLKQTLLPQSIQYLENTLRPEKSGANTVPRLPNVGALRAYLMLGDAQHFDSTDVIRSLSTPPGLPAALTPHLRALFAPGRFNADVEVNQGLIRNTRLDMRMASATSSIWTPVFAELQRQKLPPFSVIDIAGDASQLLFVRPSGKPLSQAVEGAYTAAAYPHYLALRAELAQNAGAATWVTGETNDRDHATALGSALDQQYAQAYIAAWDGFLNDFVIAHAANLDQAAKIAASLSGPDSAMRKVFTQAALQMRLPPGVVGDQVREHFSRFLDYVGAPPTSAAVPAATVAGGKGAAGALGAVSTLSASGPSSGAPVPAMSGDGTVTTPLAQTLIAMKDVASYLTAAEIARQTGLPAPPDGAVARLNATLQGAPAVVIATAGGVGEAGPALLRGDAYARVNALWRNTTGPACQLALEGRYPMVAGAAETVAVDDFARVFATGGLMDGFFQTQLAPLVDSSVTPWRWRKDAVPAGTPNSALLAFQRAGKIRDAYFPNGSRAVSFHFSLLPIDMDAGLVMMNFDFGGLHWNVGTGPQAAVALDWPTDEPTDRIRIGTNPSDGPASLTFDQGGLWAPLRMFDAGKLQTTKQADQFVLHLGRNSTFKVIARSVVNPLNPALMREFRCPDHL